MAITFPSTEDINARLDDLESRLPTVPARILKLQRALAAANCERTRGAFSAIADSTKSFLDTARTSGKTVTGQARAAAGDVAATVRTNVNTVTGQASAQGKRVARAAEKQATKLVDDAIETVEGDLDTAIDAVDQAPGSGTPYEQWTKADLVERAKDLNITGPTRMSKAELIDALRAA
jgi:hypothetical protein